MSLPLISFNTAGEIRSISAQPILALDISADNQYIIAGGGSSEMGFVAGVNKDFLNDSASIMDSCSVSKIPLNNTGIMPTCGSIAYIYIVVLLMMLCALVVGTATVRFREDGRIFLSGHWDGTLQIRERKSLKLLAVLRYA